MHEDLQTMFEIGHLIKSIISYDPDTGFFLWKIRHRRQGGFSEIGDIVGTVNDQGYILIQLMGYRWRAHRLAWWFMMGEFPPSGFDIDHIDRVRSNNKWNNLRLLTRSRNNRNTGRVRVDNTTGYRGVHRQPNGTFFARITVDGKIIHLGTYPTIEEAHAARLRAEERHPV
jgi:HNH endonuclease